MQDYDDSLVTRLEDAFEEVGDGTEIKATFGSNEYLIFYDIDHKDGAIWKQALLTQRGESQDTGADVHDEDTGADAHDEDNEVVAEVVAEVEAEVEAEPGDDDDDADSDETREM